MATVFSVISRNGYLNQLSPYIQGNCNYSEVHLWCK